MSEPIFEFVATALQESTTLDKLSARGTLRIALRNAGLDPREVTRDQMRVVLERVMPQELISRGIEGAPGLCAALAGSLDGLANEPSPGRAETVEEIFRRLGR